MDETLTRVAIDISGRPFLVWKVDVRPRKIGEFDTELVSEWFQAFAQNAGMTLHVETLYGTNNHHIAEILLQGARAGPARGGSASIRAPGESPRPRAGSDDSSPEPSVRPPALRRGGRTGRLCP